MEMMGNKMIKAHDKRIRSRYYNGWYKIAHVQDIVFEIFSRLDLVSLGKCEAVSKAWLTWIRSPNFAKLHLSIARDNPIYIIFPQLTYDIDVFTMDKDGGIHEEPYFPNYLPQFYGINLDKICSHNGLVCCTHSVTSSSTSLIKTNVYMLNPTTMNTFLLPKRRRSLKEPAFGVAFGPRIYDYTVFRFVSPGEKNIKRCEIYSSCTGQWTNTGVVPECQVGPMGSNHIFVDGKVYWLVSSEADSLIATSILSVDLKEKFQILSLPPEEATEHSFLVDLEGHLSMVIVYPNKNNLIEIWVLMNCSDCLWVKKCSTNLPAIPADDIPDPGSVNSVTVRVNDVLFSTTTCYLIFNLESRNWKPVADNTGLETRLGFSHVETLLPCHQVLQILLLSIQNRRRPSEGDAIF